MYPKAGFHSYYDQNGNLTVFYLTRKFEIKYWKPMIVKYKMIIVRHRHHVVQVVWTSVNFRKHLSKGVFKRQCTTWMIKLVLLSVSGHWFGFLCSLNSFPSNIRSDELHFLKNGMKERLIISCIASYIITRRKNSFCRFSGLLGP